MRRETSIKIFPSLDRSRTEYAHGFARMQDPLLIDDISRRVNNPVVYAIMFHDLITATEGLSEERTMTVLVMAVVFVLREVLFGGMPFDGLSA